MEKSIPHTAEKRYRFSAMTAPEVTLDIFDEIDDWWGYGVPTLAYELSKLNASQALTVRIHSPGGSVTEGLGIRNLLLAYPGELTTVGVGFVASIASIILLAGKKVKMSDNAYLMIHRPYGAMMGNADEMKRTAATLENMDENLLDIYMQAIESRGKGGEGKRNEVWEYMKNETWFTARQALELGFIDEVIGAEEIPQGAQGFQALAKFQNVPKQLIDNEKKDMSKSILDQMRALLNGTPEADAPVAEAAPVAEPAPIVSVDPLEAARKLLEENGYSVNETAAAPQEDAEAVALMQALAQEVKALRTQVAAAKAVPSGGSTEEGKTGKREATARDAQYSSFAEFVKRKIGTR